MMVTPVSVSALRIDHSIGAGPRWRGSNDAWTLIVPNRGALSRLAGRICPYATPTMTAASPRHLANPGLGGLVPDPLGLKDLQSHFLGEQLGSRLQQSQSAPRCPVGLRHDPGALVSV